MKPYKLANRMKMEAKRSLDSSSEPSLPTAGRIKLKVYASLGAASGHSFDLALQPACTLLDFLHQAAIQLGFASQLFDEAGGLKRSYTVLINGTSYIYLGGLNTALQNGDEVAILAFVTGGSN